MFLIIYPWGVILTFVVVKSVLGRGHDFMIQVNEIVSYLVAVFWPFLPLMVLYCCWVRVREEESGFDL